MDKVTNSTAQIYYHIIHKKSQYGWVGFCVILSKAITISLIFSKVGGSQLPQSKDWGL